MTTAGLVTAEPNVSRPPAAARRRRPGTIRWAIWLIPAVALTMVFTVYPGIAAARLSLYNYAGYGDQTWAGFHNYTVLFRDPVFRKALWNTVQFAVVTAVGTVVVGTLIAVHLNRQSTYTRIVKAVVFLPVILPVVFTGLVWVFGLDSNFGWVNQLLDGVHAGLGPAWLSKPSLVMWTIEIVTILQFSGLPMIVVLAALQDVSPEIQEAASLDGVSPWQRLRYITLPLVKDVIFTVLLLQLMYGFKVFDQVFVMTRGGPGHASEVTSTYVYNEAFQRQHFGLGAAGAVVTCLVVIVVSMAYLSVFRPGRIERG